MAAEDAAVDQEEATRSRTYALLASFFVTAPDAQRLAALGGAEPDSGQGPLGEAWISLSRAAASADPEQVDGEFHDLFIGLGRGELMPYASWYLTGFLFGRPLVRLRSDLAALGFERAPDVHEPEDHIAALFDIMAALTDPRQGEALPGQQRFFAEHIAPWAERFMADLRGARAAGFYRVVGELGERFMVLEKQYLGIAGATAAAEA